MACGHKQRQIGARTEKRFFWRALVSQMVYKVCETFIMIVSILFSNLISIVHVDIMNVVYQPPLQLLQCKTMMECMMQKLLRKLSGFVICSSVQTLRKIYFHCESSSCMTRQKEVEQIRRSVQRTTDSIELKNHPFDAEMNFSWTDITAQQSEKSIFSSYFVWLSPIYIQILRDRFSTEQEDNVYRQTVLCQVLWQCRRAFLTQITQRVPHCAGMSCSVSSARRQIKCHILRMLEYGNS